MDDDENVDVVKITLETYDKTADLYSTLHSNILQKDLDYFISYTEGRRILDVGCGHGNDALYFVEKGFDVVGIDLCDRFLEISQKKVPTAIFLKMDLREIEFPNIFFDGIWMNASLLHIPKKEVKEVLSQFSCVLKDRGVMYISLKLGNGEKFIQNNRYAGFKKYFALYSKQEILNILQELGFDTISASYSTKHSTQESWIHIFVTKAWG